MLRPPSELSDGARARVSEVRLTRLTVVAGTMASVSVTRPSTQRTGRVAPRGGPPGSAARDHDEAADRWLETLLDGLRVELEPTVREHLRLGQTPTDRPLDQLVRMMAAPIPRPSPWNDSVGPFYDSTGVRRLLGVTRQALAQQRSRCTILALETADGHLLYPTFQFDEHRRVLPGLAEVLGAVPAGAVDGWTLASWLNRSRLASLGGTVVAHLQGRGDLAPAVQAARGAGARWAA